MSAPHLGHTSLNINALRDLSRKELTDVLDSARGKKTLVLDPNLSGPLSLITEFSLLKEHGVEKIFYLQSGPLETESSSIIYICRPNIQYVRYIAEHVKQLSDTGKNFNLFFVPRRTMICERLLEEEGVYGDITIGEYHLDLIPFEDDLLSLELDNSFKELYLDGDNTSIYYVARAIMRLQSVYGFFPRIIGKGDCAKLLSDMLLRMRREMAIDDPLVTQSMSISSNIDSLVIVDRASDLVTPLCTQLTYEGLVDEYFGIKNTFVEVDAAVAPSSPNPAGSSSGAANPPTNKKKKVPLNSSDKLFSEIRDMNFAVVGSVLNKVAKRINEDYEGRHHAKTVGQIREFIGKLGGLQNEHLSLKTHTTLAEQIMSCTTSEDFNRMLEVQQNFTAGYDTNTQSPYIEELINRQAPLLQVLRLLCLQSLVNNGLKSKTYDFFRKEIIQTYGYEHIVTLHNLAKVGLLKIQDVNRNPYPQVRKSLRLIVDQVDERSPNDIAYVYSGYAPLSVRLVQCVYRNTAPTVRNAVGVGAGWKGLEDVIRMIPGKMFDEVQPVEDGIARTVKRWNKSGQPRISIVLFLGGCTYTEISAIRFLSQQEEGREYVIATTQIINGNTLLDPLIEKVNHD
ncbi:vacuolar protein sorting-associated protein 33A [Basidiobolus meristosporus CBS 931.73]|uniref:Vacuolar protein sorting-associated protein 33A n=1 Tax=Basidiobolus meristosporus CBS 931.73 TaxID=1314790 RepID=A0A1Y1XUL5_9FUNG|nr:vacuolar protein sorting-associated protein 33A [Basidiobolus meristosporus CBS 931.73]|eukprot:ORX89440.1 vacuolar protein sorting-associated protein 33A [Basidiobolus meristosporus CBS 931.73]